MLNNLGCWREERPAEIRVSQECTKKSLLSGASLARHPIRGEKTVNRDFAMGSSLFRRFAKSSRSEQGENDPLRQDLLNNFPCDIGQAIVAAGVSEGQSLVVEPQQVKDRGVQVMHVDRVGVWRNA